LHNPYLDEDIQPLALAEAEIDDLVAFMASLTSADYRTPESPNWRGSALAQTSRPQRDTARAFGPKPVRPKPPRGCK
jgi:cytochrome c peroxidase